MTLKDILKDLENKKIAIGHFNFAELTVLEACAKAAQELSLPIIVGTSEGERNFIGVKEAVAAVKVLKDQGLNIFLNADHTKSLEKIKEAVEAGYDAVLFDGSELPLAENIQKTKEVIDWVKSINSSILVEGEIGFIGSGSQLRDQVPSGVELTSVEDAVRFVKETGVDLLAPAVGNVHGIVKTGEPRLNIERIREIKDAVKIPLVLHGASGNTDEDIKAAIQAGIGIVHINTEVRVAWHDALAKTLETDPEEVAPYKILASAQEAARSLVFNKLKLMNLLQ